MPTRTMKIFFRASESEVDFWRSRSKQANLSIDAMIREASELYALIPSENVAAVRRLILEFVGKSSAASESVERAVIMQSREEAHLVEQILDLLRKNHEPESSILRVLAGGRIP